MLSVPLFQERNWKSNFAESKGGETGWKGRQQCLPLHPLRPHLLRLLHRRPHGEVHQAGERGDPLWKLLRRVRGEKMVRHNIVVTRQSCVFWVLETWFIGNWEFCWWPSQPRSSLPKLASPAGRGGCCPERIYAFSFYIWLGMWIGNTWNIISCLSLLLDLLISSLVENLALIVH